MEHFASPPTALTEKQFWPHLVGVVVPIITVRRCAHHHMLYSLSSSSSSLAPSLFFFNASCVTRPSVASLVLLQYPTLSFSPVMGTTSFQCTSFGPAGGRACTLPETVLLLLHCFERPWTSKCRGKSIDSQYRRINIKCQLTRKHSYETIDIMYIHLYLIQFIIVV